jgi:hypothetical protein
MGSFLISLLTVVLLNAVSMNNLIFCLLFFIDRVFFLVLYQRKRTEFKSNADNQTLQK